MRTPTSAEFLLAGESFFDNVVTELVQKGFSLEELNFADHLCLRVASQSEYETYQVFLASMGALLSEAMVNGRPISTYRLHRPFCWQEYDIHLIELPSPKSGTPYETGFEHAEFVITKPFVEFCASHPNVKFEIYPEKSFNSEIGVLLPSGQAKFHHVPLDLVIAREESGVRPSP